MSLFKLLIKFFQVKARRLGQWVNGLGHRLLELQLQSSSFNITKSGHKSMRILLALTKLNKYLKD